MRRILRILCWIKYLWIEGGNSCHSWKLKETITSVDKLEKEQMERNKYTTLQIATPHYTKIYECSICKAKRSESGWNNMVVRINK